MGNEVLTHLHVFGQISDSCFQVLVRFRSKVLLVKIVTLYALGDDLVLGHFSLLISHLSVAN